MSQEEQDSRTTKEELPCMMLAKSERLLAKLCKNRNQEKAIDTRRGLE